MNSAVSISAPQVDREASRRMAPVRAWLWLLAGLVLVMILVGGATRLTDSGLSITEWKPVTGALLPMSEEAWQREFDLYRQIPQYELVNKGMTLAEFKSIYLWEWGHRQLGRFIGLAFFLPLAFFAWRGQVRGRLLLTIAAIGAMGGLQATVGWIMVASGLKPGMTAVAPVKLMLHMLIACGILGALVWVATGLGRFAPEHAPARLRRTASLLIGLTVLQIALGAIVAGLDAGLSYNTWPLMDGRLVPSAATLFPITPWAENFVESIALVQFNHRLGAYLLLALALWHAVDALRSAPGSAPARRATLLAALVVVQALVGITTLLLVVPLWAALLHQGLAVLLLGACVHHRRRLAEPAPLAVPARA
ncbi:COX15/CtaA family protein [Chelatococcus sp. XZ-Ab1]|uniref:COX15/CtaA family protein n=1 Tax=Chelatococcus sp. XZ-Ab1 TaxID=3034027 RepID=UPI0023E3B1BB|nr:COX15/CtaA family protein [Chelatococcus sp. XZ-Ab1]